MRTLLLTAMLFAAAAFGLGALAAHAGEAMCLESFDGRRIPDTVTAAEADLKLVRPKDGGGRALRVRFAAGSQPGITLQPSDGDWDWRAYAGVAVDVRNPGADPAELYLRVDSLGEDGQRLSARGPNAIPPGGAATATLFFRNWGGGPYWGMRGIPVRGPVTLHGPGIRGFEMEPAKVTALRVYLLRPESERELVLDNIRLFEPGDPLEQLVPLPFIDRFGQYIHADWPGKIHSEDELRAVHQAELAALDAAEPLPGMDRFGGWAGGPQLEATGWFRTEKVDGKWWLVTPEGHLFLSMGVTCVNWGDSTFISGRDGWFEWVPEPNGPFSEFRGHQRGVHSMAEPIGGDGDTVRFYGLNLKRKLGDNWTEQAANLAHRRLQAWGFNTIANWSDGTVLKNSPIPFTAGGGTTGRKLEGSSGFWGKMTDVFAPDFAAETDKRMASAAAPYADNPYVIGYFVDNEMSWNTIAKATLESPLDQPARAVFIADLAAEYGTVDKVNAAWGTDAADWDALRVPAKLTPACREDIDAFEYKFGRQYFDTVAEALRKYAPNQLYLGCRFTLRYCPEPVLKACADVADVVSINLYQPEVPAGTFADLGKPYIIGEFHFGALDRGMFSRGLQSAADQNERAACYVRYVESMARNPLFVGCHWFEYLDQPTTGRASDGENYSIGLVSIADVPYKELTEAARDVHGRAYRLRHEAK